MERIELSGLKSLKLIIKPGGEIEGVLVFRVEDDNLRLDVLLERADGSWR